MTNRTFQITVKVRWFSIALTVMWTGLLALLPPPRLNAGRSSEGQVPFSEQQSRNAATQYAQAGRSGLIDADSLTAYSSPGSDQFAEAPISGLPPGATVEPVWIWQETSDCLWNMAKEHYGDPFLWPRIYEANRDLIEDPNVIFPKQRIVIPSLEENFVPAPLKKPMEFVPEERPREKPQRQKSGGGSRQEQILRGQINP